MGSYIGIRAIDRFGRKLTIMLCSVPFVTGWVIIAGAKNEGLLYLGRIVTGVGMRIASLAVPVRS